VLVIIAIMSPKVLPAQSLYEYDHSGRGILTEDDCNALATQTIESWGYLWSDKSAEPTLACMAEVAGFPRAPEPGCWFRTQRFRWRFPVCFEYSAPLPHGEIYGPLNANTWMQAKEVAVVLIPEDTRRGKHPEWGIAIRCDSIRFCGKDAWVNVSRQNVVFADCLGGPGGWGRTCDGSGGGWSWN